MERLTTDNPQNNLEVMMNYAFAENRRVVLRYADGEDNADLCKYISDEAKKIGCDMSPGDVMGGGCMECDCALSVLFSVATQAAELRARLKRYEDMEEAGRLVVLDTPMLPLIWGDDNHDTILCPKCEQDLMGGFELAGPGEDPMFQCPRCGQPIDATKALTREEAEKALKGGGAYG